MKLTEMTPKEFCDATNACPEGREFALKYQSMSEVWDECFKVDWLLWICDKTGMPDDKTLRLFAVWCARNTPLADGRKTGDLLTDPRALAALAVAERFANGRADSSELLDAADAAAAARDAAWDAARSAAGSAAGSATWIAARGAAGSAARSAADAARSAARSAAGSAADAAWIAAGSAARDAAGSAARDAAAPAQSTQFRLMVKNPFI